MCLIQNKINKDYLKIVSTDKHSVKAINDTTGKVETLTWGDVDDYLVVNCKNVCGGKCIFGRGAVKHEEFFSGNYGHLEKIIARMKEGK